MVVPKGMAFAIILVFAGSVVAQPASDDVARAEAAMARGIEADKRGDHEAALAAYREAQALAPTANVPHKHAGEVLEKLGRYPEALEAYRRYLEVSPTGKSAGEIRGRIERIEREHVATLVVPCRPDGARITIDGLDVGTAPRAPVVLVAPKSYGVRVEAAGYVPITKTLELAAGSRIELPCTLAPVDLRPRDPPPPPPLVEPVEPERTAPRPWYRRPLVVGPVIGAAVAIVSVGLYFTFSGGAPDSHGGAHPLP